MSDFRAIIEIDISSPADGTTAADLEAMSPNQLLTMGHVYLSVEPVQRRGRRVH